VTRASDVIVVGGGIVGCAISYFLAREGLSVVLLERDQLAVHASGAAAGMLLPLAEAAQRGPLHAWGRRSLAMFPELCAELRERSGVDPEYEASGALHLAESEPRAQQLQAKARLFEAESLEWLGPEALRGAEPLLGPGLCGALWSPGEGHVRSPLLTQAFARAAAELGARIETGSTVTGVRRAGERVTGVETASGSHSAGSVVLCMGAWTPGVVGFALPIEPVRGQILSLDAPRSPLGSIVVGESAYLVPKRDGSVVVGASEERVGFDCRVTAEGMGRLLAAAPRLVPALADCGFRSAWAGLRPATPDGLPVIGPAPGSEGLVIAAGHFRNGVLLSPVSGRLVADLLLGKALPEDAAAFRPERFTSTT
jgi:glycine oxidase